MEHHPAAHPQQEVQPAPVAVQPTDTMGIVSICLSGFGTLMMLLLPLFGFPLTIAGLIVGIIGANKAKTAGHKQTVSKIGWIIGLVGTIIGLLITIVGILFFVFLISQAPEAGSSSSR